MKKIFNALFFIAFLLIVYAVLYFILKKLGLNKTLTFDIVTASLLLFGVLGLTYNFWWHKDTMSRRPILFTLVILISFLAFTLFIRISRQSYELFQHLATTEGKHWEGRVFQSDPVLGHVPIRCASGYLSLESNHAIIHHIPLKYDDNGFRIPDSASCHTTLTRPIILFLGCSFTEGADCPEEKTFSYLVGDSLHGIGLNAGVSSYGFSQMYILANRLIPQIKPDYVVVQYSPWLADRARSKFAPTYGLEIPSPYFEKIDDSMMIHPPCYSTSCFSLNWKYNKQKGKLANFFSFYFNEGFSLVARDHLKVFMAKLSQKSPASNKQQVEKSFLDKMVELTGQNNSKLVVVDLGDIAYTQNSHKLVNNDNIRFAEADSLLWKKVNFNKTAFEKSYYWWGSDGKDSIILDRHPTDLAHAVIAESILQAIRK